MEFGITEHIIRFSHYLRQKGLSVGVKESLEALEAARLGVILDANVFKYALKSIFCTSEKESRIFEELFAAYWQKKLEKGQKKILDHRERIIRHEHKKASLLFLGKQNTEKRTESELESQSITGASRVEKMTRTDFSKIEEVDSEFLEALAQKLWRQMNQRLSRRFKLAPKSGQVDLRRTIRKNIQNGGEMIDLHRKKRKKRKPSLVVLLDVSGSMDKYSLFLLRFIYALQGNFERLEAFLFSTRITPITDLLKNKTLTQNLSLLSERADFWSSGTKIGSCFEDFNRHYSNHCLNSNSIVIILSDGLDTGEPEILGYELGKIARKARKLIWLNPLKGMNNYEPLARGMQSALPHLDVFQSAHNLESLLALEKYLENV
ncbi:MAG: VWA domain-containing protein [Microscillaceae bacterium]|nr:VWA domain-containing protein [Microscillaceae bacterium]